MATDAITVGSVDLTEPDVYLAGMPYDAFRELRHRAPVAWHPHGDTGFWALTRYDDIYAVSRDSETWSSQATGVFFDVPAPEDAYQLELMMLTMDPPRHTALRALVSRGFTPRHVARLSARTADMARAIVDDALERGECEFVNDVAGALPSYVIAELLGIPLEDGRRLYALTDIMNTRPLHDPELVQAQMQMFEYASELAALKRASPGDDIATALLHAEVDGQRLTDLEFNLFFLLLLNAGGDTTRNLVAAGTLALIEHPEQRRRLTADPSLMPTAIEEMLRWTSPVTVFTRTATRDTEVGGVRMRAGERVAMFYPSANRDEAHFADPDRFDVGRTPNQHLAFGGGGTHFCLGASLARAEAAAIFSEILARTTDIEPIGPAERVRSVLMNGIRSMPVRLVPAAVPA
ncbi:cytochrome P450 [Mycolicibacterium parafortuitum]|uniref:Steroid C26-monooxygenase n=1 Tax=Mycolicibacterium parafortuitum TaxID=39692 RepID=A0A7I7TYF7_MYCPF|nr:cytochrome P450 [Mycolicibacterium parafortuitum]BBY74158.1 cytochrome P450 [Mycolicibacterium parafortuitum]